MDTYDARGRRLDEPEEPVPHYHLLALDAGVIDFADHSAQIAGRLRALAAEYGARHFAVKYCWGFRCAT